ncbi:ABC transporter permease [Campylobacterota bacterium]|nr:ABC transporter permease [Campylobacterota bacterium]
MLAAFFLRRRSRAAAAFLAVTIGSIALFGMLTIYFAAPASLAKAFRVYGANVVITGSAGLTSDDLQRVRSAVPPDLLVGFAPYTYISVMFSNRVVTAVSTDLAQAAAINPFWQIDGRLPSAGEALIGAELARTLRLEIGSVAAIADLGTDVMISGVLKTGGNEENFVYFDGVPLGKNTAADLAEISVSLSGEPLGALVQSLQNSFPHLTPKIIARLANPETAALGKLAVLMLIVTVITLALAMICVFSTMTAVVLERAKEIGLKKAIGASSSEIVVEFVCQAAALGLCGGVCGCALGFAFANCVSESVFGAAVGFDFGLAVAATAAAVVCTALAGVYPVLRAAGVNPIAVLRGE